MGRVLIKLGIVALAGVGVWLLWERYGKRVERLEGPARHFADRATSAVEDAGRTVGRAGSLAADAVEGAAARIADAATVAGHEASAEFSN